MNSEVVFLLISVITSLVGLVFFIIFIGYLHRKSPNYSKAYSNKLNLITILLVIFIFGVGFVKNDLLRMVLQGVFILAVFVLFFIRIKFDDKYVVSN